MHIAGPLDKISQILVYSQNYSSHLKNLQHIKSAIDQSNQKRNRKNRKLHQQHQRYVQAILKQKNKQLLKENNKVVNKILDIQKRKTQQTNISKQSAQRHSLTSKSFDNLMISKSRFRAKKNKQIQIQNMKITQRITKSRNKDSFCIQDYKKQTKKMKKDLSLLGRYSQRSQSVLSDLISKNLKLKQQSIPFLPQILAKNMKNRSKLKQQNFSQNKQELNFRQQTSIKNIQKNKRNSFKLVVKNQHRDRIVSKSNIAKNEKKFAF